MSKVYGLKGATGKMKLHHMHYMMAWKERLNEVRDTELALHEIKELMHDQAEDYHNWFAEVFDKFYYTDKQEYARLIFEKLDELSQISENETNQETKHE